MEFPLAAVNTSALQGSPYIQSLSKDSYTLNNQEPKTLARAADALSTLLKDNPQLCPIFRTEPRNILLAEIGRKPCLTLNGRAVCLSRERHVSGLAPLFLDRHFSMNRISIPVHCPEGHCFEKEYIELWRLRMGDTCPAGNHPLGNLTVDLLDLGLAFLERVCAIWNALKQPRLP